MMQRVKNGLVAGFAATAVVTILEAINMYGVKLFAPYPALVARIVGAPGNAAVGWAVHILFGIVVLGIAFGLLYDRLPTKTPVTKGIAFSIAAWVLVMLYITMVMPASGSIATGGFGVIAWMMFTHAIYGTILGKVFYTLQMRDKAHLHEMGAAAVH